ncbi:MAG: hypothetical protein LUH05_04915 [Candidatus Gastranaerophilales bacterium]|nr:hypothetical protein [Candidatus Gastranaerophilales bacterium]
MIEDIKCPFCGYTDEECYFPDLYIEDKKQHKLLQELQKLGYNLVTCGMCGEVIITKENH